MIINNQFLENLHSKSGPVYSVPTLTSSIVSFPACYRMAVTSSAEPEQKHHKQPKGKMYLTAAFAKRRERKKNSPKELNTS